MSRKEDVCELVLCVSTRVCFYIDVKPLGKMKAHIWNYLTTASKEEKDKQAVHVIKGIRKWTKYKEN